MIGLPEFLFALILYFAPSIIAAVRGKHNAWAIAVLNILMGWLIIPWIIALVWSLMAEPPGRRYGDNDNQIVDYD